MCVGVLVPIPTSLLLKTKLLLPPNPDPVLYCTELTGPPAGVEKLDALVAWYVPSAK